MSRPPAGRWARGPARVRSRRTDERGVVAILSSLIAVVLLVVAAFVVDIGGTWARRGDLQVQADKAALYAARSLPAVGEAGEKRVARQVAYYLACTDEGVIGQRQESARPEWDMAIPDCPDGTTVDSTAIAAFGDKLLAKGWVDFPTPVEVSVTSPPARVEFGFGRAAGADASVQQKSATAKVYSPGDVLPLGLSLPCMANGLTNSGIVGNETSSILPLNYVSVGTPRAGDSNAIGGVQWPAGYASAASPTVTGVTVSKDLTGALQVTVKGTGWNALTLGLEVWFSREGKGPHKSASLLNLVNGEVTVPIPAEVSSVQGDWRVKVAINNLLGTDPISTSEAVVTVPTPSGQLTDILDLDHLVSCTRVTENPRSDVADRFLTHNLRHGLDHPIRQHPQLATVLQTLDAGSLMAASLNVIQQHLSNPSLLFSCAESDGQSVLDTAANIGAGKVANCLTVNASPDPAQQLTDGLVGPQGRLSCSVTDCSSGSFTIPGIGGSYNDDDFDDFVIDDRKSLLTDNLFFALGSYLQPGLPVVTPQDALDDAIYSSPRFFWAPVLTTAYTTTAAGDYPVLTFRPVFMTQKAPADAPVAQVVDELAMDILGKLQTTTVGILDGLLDGLGINSLLQLLQVDEPLDSILYELGGTAPMAEYGGLVVDTEDNLVKAARLMTIEPMALPSAPDDYEGPVTDYLGTGPKVVRIVR